MGQVITLGRVPLDLDISPRWEDAFSEEGVQALTDTISLVQQVIQQPGPGAGESGQENSQDPVCQPSMLSPGGTGCSEGAPSAAPSSSLSLWFRQLCIEDVFKNIPGLHCSTRIDFRVDSECALWCL